MILFWLGCSTADPELTAKRQSLDAWSEGMVALKEQDPASAAMAFERAEASQPDDVLLAAWRAKAHADAGDLQGAVDRLESVLERAPRFGEARYNRAAYLARLGEVEEAAAELQRALAGGGLSPRDAMRDPDFMPHLGTVDFSFLPSEMLLVAVDAPTETVFWGSEATVRFRIVGADGAAVSLVAETLSGPAVVVAVVEDVIDSTDGPVRDLTYTLKVLGEGEVVLGPIEVRSVNWTKTVPAVRFPTAAPQGKARPAGAPPLELLIPSALRGDLRLPGARRLGDTIDVLSRGLDRVTLSPPPQGKPIRYELRDRSRTEWVLQRSVASETTVRVRRGGATVLDETL